MALPEHLAELERKVSERLSEALAKTRQEMRRAVAAEAQRANSAMLAELDAITPPAAPGLLVQEELAEVARVAGGESRRAFAREQRGAFVEFDLPAGAAIGFTLAAGLLVATGLLLRYERSRA